LNSCEDLFGVERSQIEKFVSELHRFRPDIVFCNPVYLHWFGRKATEWGIALPPVKVLSSSYQYRSLLQTRGLRQVFGAPIYDYYGCTEAAATPGQECLNGRLHVRSEQCLVEVVNEQGGPVPLQTLGALVITTTAARTMPLVRYMVGDVGCLQEADCSCVLDGCPTIVLHGRAKDMLYLQNRWVTTRQFDDVIGKTEHLDFYSCKQIDERTLQVKVIPFLGYEGSFPCAEVAEELSNVFSVANVVVESTHRLDPLPGSLKFALTQCAYREPPSCP
jgi:phenylacetate-coenzyme A ligase PaaK-like adenylate-forming protein